jgi:hypothetical protein
MAERKDAALSVEVNSLEKKPKCCAPEAMKAKAGRLPSSQFAPGSLPIHPVTNPNEAV